MIRLLALALLSCGGIAGAIGMVIRGNAPGPVSLPVLPSVEPSFPTFITGAGLVEAGSEDIAVGVPLGGIVTAVPVVPGMHVRAGEVLFTLDDRSARAELEERTAMADASRARLERLRQLPRREDIPPVEARLQQARADAADSTEHLHKLEAVGAAGGVTRNDLDHAHRLAESVSAKVIQSEAELASLRAGAWPPDLAVATADVLVAETQERTARTQLERLSVRAPRDGDVLQLTVHVGEFATPGSAQPLLVLGSTDELRVRVDIDELDAWRITPALAAEARLPGNPRIRLPLRFVRAEPLVVPKQSLTGLGGERVDARVLRVIYAFDRGQRPIFVGQQLDVMINAPTIHQ